MNDLLKNTIKPQNIEELYQKILKIVDSFPFVVNKFGRAHFRKRLREYANCEYCASKKETYHGMKIHVVWDLYENPIDYLLTKANVDDSDSLYEFSEIVNIRTLFGDKDYVGNISEELKKEKGITLYALKRGNRVCPKIRVNVNFPW